MAESPEAPPTPPEGQAAAGVSPPLSPLQSRLKWLELATHLLLFSAVALFAWTTLTALVRPTARRMLEPISRSSAPIYDGPADSPLDFFRSESDDGEGADPPLRGPSRARPNVFEDGANEGDDKAGKSELNAAVVGSDAKLYTKPSEQAVEMGAVKAGETVFVMKDAGGWVLVLRGEGALVGWMRKDSLSSR